MWLVGVEKSLNKHLDLWIIYYGVTKFNCAHFQLCTIIPYLLVSSFSSFLSVLLKNIEVEKKT